MTGTTTYDLHDPLLERPEVPEEESGPSAIAEFFAGKNILITGATGFLGRLLIDKILRSCPDVAKFYLCMRPKKGKTPDERFKEIFDDPLFDTLRAKRSDFRNKLTIVDSEMGQPDLGLTPESRKMLMDVNVVFHCAATVRFDETLKVATYINIRATKLMLKLAREMPDLQAFVQVSTAFCYCPRKFIEEKFYDSPVSPDGIISAVGRINELKLKHLTPKILGDWPNTYAFTKAISEQAVRQYGKGMPVCLVRPSIIISTANDPFPGWTNNFYGATGVVYGAALGVLRTLHCKEENIADIVPADYVVANIIACAWNTATTQKSIPASIGVADEQRKEAAIDEIPVYNIVSSCQNPLTWREFCYLNEIYGFFFPSHITIWYYSFRLIRYEYLNWLRQAVMHYLPALLVDLVAILLRRKPMLTNGYRKIHRFSQVISYFATQEWKFTNDNVVKLWNKLGPGDRRKFQFDMRALDWNRYFFYHIRGLRIYLGKDPIDTVAAGQVKYNRLMMIHYTLTSFSRCLVIYLVYLFIRFVWRLFFSLFE